MLNFCGNMSVSLKASSQNSAMDALNRLSDFYLAMRSASETEGSPVAITARQLESLVRVAEARARVALRKEVTAEDAEAAIAIMKRSLEEVGIDMSIIQSGH